MLSVPVILAALAIPVGSVHAQRIVLSVGDSTRVTVAPGTKLAVPIGVDLSGAGSATLASLQASLAWGSSRLTFDSLRVVAATGFSLTPNLTAVSTGSLTFNAFSSSALAASGPIATAYFTATATSGGTSVVLTPATAGSELGSSVLNALNVRNLGVCVAPSGKWGDVNDDGTVNIIDAQQIARSSVGLSVANAAAVSGRGDVTADGTVNIIDAQQIARASVALSAAARVNTALFTPPVVASVTLTPGTATNVVTGSALALAAVSRDSAGVDLGGCAPVTWSSSNPSTATVSSGGVVVAVATGSATITATSGTRSATVPLTVVPPYALALAASPVGGTTSTFLPTQPVVVVQAPGGSVVSGEVRQITATLASGSGSLSGTTTVSTVNGVATFTDLAITGTGAHTLTFTTTGASAVTSGAVSMVAPTSMRLLVAATPSLAGTAATDVVIPVLLDLSGRGSQDLAAITATLSWDPAKYTYVSNAAGTWVDVTGGAASVTVNATNTASGTLSLTGFTTDATTASATLRTITLRPVASGPLVMSATVSTAGNVNGQSVTVVPRNLGGTVINPAVATVTVSTPSVFVTAGETLQLTAVARDANGSVMAGVPILWSSATPSVATISTTGVLTAVAAGAVMVGATALGVTGDVSLTVQAPGWSRLVTLESSARVSGGSAYDAATGRIWVTHSDGVVRSWHPGTGWSQFDVSATVGSCFNVYFDSTSQDLILPKCDLTTAFRATQAGAVSLLGGSGNSGMWYGAEVGYSWNQLDRAVMAFGGYGGCGTRGDLMQFTSSWSTRVGFQSNGPWAREGAQTTVDAEARKFYLYAGDGFGRPDGAQSPCAQNTTRYMYNDLWELDLQTNGWRNVVPMNSVAGGGQWVSGVVAACPGRGELYMFALNTQTYAGSGVSPSSLHRIRPATETAWTALTALASPAYSASTNGQLVCDVARNRILFVQSTSGGGAIWSHPLPRR